jgi:hypothetical protein
MPQCRAITNAGIRCIKTTMLSKYCWWHKEHASGVVWALVGIVLGWLGNVVVAIYQERAPFVSVRCSPLDSWKPIGVECIVHNTGRGEARDVRVSFNSMLPLDTLVRARPEIGAELIPSPTPPDPEKTPEWAKTQLAFSVRIPRIISKDSLSFQVTTIDADNEKAAGQILRIREEFSTVLKMFIERLEKINPEAVKQLNYDKIMSAQTKRDTLFIPARFSYEAGQQKIEYFSEEEQAAEALFNSTFR